MNIKDLKVNNLEGLELKSYVPLAKKGVLINGDGAEELGIISECISIKENGMKCVNLFNKEASISILMVSEYTNIEFNEEIEGYEIIDIIIESNIVDTIVDQVPDAKRFLSMIEDQIEQELELSNTISAVVANNLTKLVNKIPDGINAKWFEKIIKSLPKMINSIEPERLNMIKAGLGFKKE